MASAGAHASPPERLQQDPSVTSSSAFSGPHQTFSREAINDAQHGTEWRRLLDTAVSKRVLQSLRSAKEVVKLPEGVMRPKAEQDMVGFGLREIIGLSRTAGAYPSSDTQMVYYATNRKSDAEDNHGSVFGKKLDTQTNFGVAEIQCPDGKPLVNRENQATHGLELEEFKQSLRQQIQADKNKAVLVYVHGCFTDFGRGVGYGSYILRGLDFKGPMVVYSWPSVGRPSVREGLVKAVELYRVDEATSMKSAEQLKDLLRFLSKEVGAESVHVVAYSMGARTLIEALRLFEPEDDLPVKSHLYFIAPDVAAHLFSETLRDFRFPRGRHQRAQGKEDGAGEGGAGLKQTSAERERRDRELGDRDREDKAREGREREDREREQTFADGVVLHDMVERVADAWNFVGDSVAGLRQLAAAWREARMTGWQELQEAIVKQWDQEEEGSEGQVPASSSVASSATVEGFRSYPRERIASQGGEGLTPSLPFRNAHVHLYAASNDVALLLSELTDPGVPQIRAGRIQPGFMLCHPGFFHTVDVTPLKSGILSTGHFYLFHEIVKEEMAHVLSGRGEVEGESGAGGEGGVAWWRQGMRWENGHQYIRLRAIHPVQVALMENAVRTWKAGEEYTVQPRVKTEPLYWASP